MTTTMIKATARNTALDMIADTLGATAVGSTERAIIVEVDGVKVPVVIKAIVKDYEVRKTPSGKTFNPYSIDDEAAAYAEDLRVKAAKKAAKAAKKAAKNQ